MHVPNKTLQVTSHTDTGIQFVYAVHPAQWASTGIQAMAGLVSAAPSWTRACAFVNTKNEELFFYRGLRCKASKDEEDISYYQARTRKLISCLLKSEGRRCSNVSLALRAATSTSRSCSKLSLIMCPPMNRNSLGSLKPSGYLLPAIFTESNIKERLTRELPVVAVVKWSSGTHCYTHRNIRLHSFVLALSVVFSSDAIN